MRIAAAVVAALLGCLPGPARAQAVPEGSCAGVYWDLTALLATGDRLYARVLVTRAGPGARNAAAFGHWIEPDGRTTAFQNGRGEGRFELDAAGRRLRIGSTRLDLEGARPHFGVDNDKRGVKIALDLESPADAAPIAVFTGDPEVDLLHLGSPSRARFWRAGMDAPRELGGFASLVRTRHRACESDLAALRIDAHRLGEGGAALLVHQRAPDGSAQSWLGWRDAAGGLRAVRPTEVALETWQEGAGGEAAPLPRSLRPKGHALTGAIAVAPAHLAIDPLDALPRLVRMLYWFGARPRRLWADATFELTAEAARSTHDALPRGAAIASFTFLRPPDEIPRPPDLGG